MIWCGWLGVTQGGGILRSGLLLSKEGGGRLRSGRSRGLIGIAETGGVFKMVGMAIPFFGLTPAVLALFTFRAFEASIGLF